MNEKYELINDPEVISSWHTTYPYYEKYGKEKIQSGTYQNLIQFEKHMKPIALYLLDS